MNVTVHFFFALICLQVLIKHFYREQQKASMLSLTQNATGKIPLLSNYSSHLQFVTVLLRDCYCQ